MNVGWVGLGKLGLPCAVALDAAGHTVTGTDVSDDPRLYLGARKVPYREAGLDRLLKTHEVSWVPSVAEVVHRADVVFVAVQTPHQARFDGTHPLPDDRADFDYTHLARAVRDVAHAAANQQKPVTLVIVSTVLPGTFDRALRPLLNHWVTAVYNPFFIAMGTTVADFTNPEFVLLGADTPRDAGPVQDVYAVVHDRPHKVVSIPTAEMTKVTYNTFIGLKVAFANTVGELCHKTAADCDDVIDCLSLATDRVVSDRYLRAGVGDGGGCHPRDNIALSWLARREHLSFDLFSALMESRERHSEWLAEQARHHAAMNSLPVWVLGKAYKPETDLTIGSPATLLVTQIGDCQQYDPHVDGPTFPTEMPQAVYLIATKHPEFAGYQFPEGSVVVDPHGYIPDAHNVTVIRVGRK